MSEWQDIENAPKDGTFLVWLEEPDHIHRSQVAVARFHPNVKFLNGQFSFDMPKPTHWMPLPPSPSDTEATP